MIFIIVRIKIIRFSINDSTYLDYIIDKLSITTPLIAIHRANIKVYIDYIIYYYSSNLRAHGVCDYGTLPVM